MEKHKENYTQLWNYVERHKSQISGGKRLRPVLTLLGAELVGGKTDLIVQPACAVEFIHTSSLIFDDLPCMDNANERRGKASLHEKFGEGLAVLVAIGFLNASYGLVFVNHSGMPERAMAAHAEIVECVGASGMVGGQSVDLALAKVFGKNQKTFAISEGAASANLRLKRTIEEAKDILIGNFPSNEARICLIQMADYLSDRKA
jgi:geranylgeranyl pyrophosphate synthase